MATYTRLVFSEQLFNDEMLKICDQALDDAVAYIKTNEWFDGSTPLQTNRDGMERYYEIPADDLKAWLVEYGTGTHMRDDNPQLVEYKRSRYYNKYRDRVGGAIATWGDIDYVQLDYESGHGVVSRHGAKPAGKKISEGVESKPFIQDLLKGAFDVFKTSLNNHIGNFNIQRCFITTQETI